jgi:hypothetical protein
LGSNLKLAASVNFPVRMRTAQANQETVPINPIQRDARRAAELYAAQPNPAIGGQHRDGPTGGQNNCRDVSSRLRSGGPNEMFGAP